MRKSKKIPLVRGLIGGKTNSIHGQLEVFLTNYETIQITIYRKPYGGRSDVKFSITMTDLQDMIDLLDEAKEKLDEYWLSKAAVTELNEKKKISIH